MIVNKDVVDRFLEELKQHLDPSAHALLRPGEPLLFSWRLRVGADGELVPTSELSLIRASEPVPYGVRSAERDGSLGTDEGEE